MTVNDRLAEYGAKVEKDRFLTDDERKTLEDIRGGYKRKYKLFYWAMSGQVALKLNIERYNQLISRHEMFRRYFLYKGLDYPVSIVVRYEKTVFPIMDLRTETPENQKSIIRNIASADARDVYNPEVDPLIKFRVLVLSDMKILVLMKAYMNMGLPLSPFDIRRLVFFNMKMDSASDVEISEKEIENINSEIETKCINYWRSELQDVNRPTRVPFEKNDGLEAADLYTIQNDFDEKLSNGIISYAQKHEGSVEHVLLKQFGHIFGEYSGTKRPLFAVRCNKSYRHVFPCKVNTELDIYEFIKDITRQEEGYISHCQCLFDKVMYEIGLPTKEYFDVAINFVNEDEMEDNEPRSFEIVNAWDDTDISPLLEITVAYSTDSISVRYVYDSGKVPENAISIIHESLVKLLEEDITNTKSFDWRNYIEECKNDEEKIEKLVIAQKALYIKQGDFIYLDDPDEIIRLSKSGMYGNYIVEDVISESGEILPNVGIIVSGHVEERMTDLDGYLKTVSVYKTGYILGMECLTNITDNQFSYVAADNVKILWLPVDLVKSAIEGNDKSYKSLLTKALNDTNRLKRLWVLD